MATTDDDDVIVGHGEKLLSEDLQRLGYRRSRGQQSAGFGTICRQANFPKQPEQRLACLGRERLKPPVFSWSQVADVASHGESCLYFGECSPRGVEKLSIVSGAFACRTFGDVQRDAIGCPAKLIGESLLLEVRKPLGRLRAFE